MIKLLVFDFDGTLADSRKILFNLIVKELKLKNYNINQKFISDFGNRPLDDVLHFIHIKEKVMPTLLRSIKGKFKEYAGRIILARNIRKLKKIRIKKIILSNNSKKVVRKVLKMNGIRLFSEVYGAEEFDKKQDMFRKIINKSGLKPHEIVYVGDRPIDAKLARKMGCYSILISNKISWSSREDILKSRPDFIVGDISEISNIIKS